MHFAHTYDANINIAAPRECVPVSDFDIGLDISNVLPKRSAIPEPAPGQHLGIGARTDISTTSPTRPIPEPDEIFKRSRDPLPPPDPDCPNCLGRRSPHWTNGNGPRYDVVEDSGTGVNNGKRDADDAVPDDRSSGVENGILIGSKIKGGSFGGGSGVPPENVVVDDYDTKIGDGIVIGSKLKRRGISGGGGSVPPEGAATEEDGTGNGNEIATECRIKRETVGGGNGAAPAAHWGIGNGKEVKERSVIGEGTVLQLGESSVSGDAVFKDWEWRAEMSV